MKTRETVTTTGEWIMTSMIWTSESVSAGHNERNEHKFDLIWIVLNEWITDEKTSVRIFVRLSVSVILLKPNCLLFSFISFVPFVIFLCLFFSFILSDKKNWFHFIVNVLCALRLYDNPSLDKCYLISRNISWRHDCLTIWLLNDGFNCWICFYIVM